MEILADLISLVLWYAFPAFVCYKTVERDGVEIEELQRWCQYWIIVAVLTILVMIADKFILGFPMYRGWVMLALIYWTYKGRADIYQNVLRLFTNQNLQRWISQPGILRIQEIFHLDALFARIEIFYANAMNEQRRQRRNRNCANNKCDFSGNHKKMYFCSGCYKKVLDLFRRD